jgi:two-component system, NtrC family, response regulator HydG
METVLEATLASPSTSTLDLSSLLESIPAAAILVDDRRTVVGANWRFRSRARAGSRCVGRLCSDLLHDGVSGCSGETWICPLESCRGSSRPCHQVHLHDSRSGAVFEAVESTPLGAASAVSRLTLQTFRPLEEPLPEPPGRLVGHSPAMLDLRRRIEELRQREAPILVLGETGTERELVARELHLSGPRRDGPFAVLAGTGLADVARLGVPWPTPALLAAAEDGTIFLDEVTTLLGECQRGLLATFSGRGWTKQRDPWRRFVGARWIFGSSRPLGPAARARELLAELVPWLSSAVVELPPLRERTGDLPLLVLALRPWLVAPRQLEIDPTVAAALAPLPLHGNLWELRRRLQDGVLNAGSGPLRPEHLVWTN